MLPSQDAHSSSSQEEHLSSSQEEQADSSLSLTLDELSSLYSATVGGPFEGGTLVFTLLFKSRNVGTCPLRGAQKYLWPRAQGSLNPALIAI